MGMLEDALRQYEAFVDRADDPAIPATGTGLIYYKAGKLHGIDDAGTVTDYSAAGVGGGTASLLHLEDRKASTTNGGTFTAGAWRTRDLNSERTNEIAGASLSANQITLPAGDYYTEWMCPAHRVDRHTSRLQNITDATTALIGHNAYSGNAGNYATSYSSGSGRFTLAAEKVLELQHRCQATSSTNGFGVDCGSLFAVDSEVYSTIRLWAV